MADNANPTNKYGQYVPAGTYQNSSAEIFHHPQCRMRTNWWKCRAITIFNVFSNRCRKYQ